MIDETKCKRYVSDGSRYGSFHRHQCTRKIWKDGFCKIHHPDIVELRNKKSDERYEEKKKKESWYKLDVAEKLLKLIYKTLDNNDIFGAKQLIDSYFEKGEY